MTGDEIEKTLDSTYEAAESTTKTLMVINIVLTILLSLSFKASLYLLSVM